MLVCIVLSILSATAQADTIFNNGDGKVVIIDKRPRTIIRTSPPVKTEPVVINIQQPTPVVNNYYYPENEPVVYPNKLPDYDPIAWLFFILLAGFGAYMIFFYKKPCHTCNHECDHKPQPPVVNHFHVAGGQAIVDGSETWTNYQPETHYHKHQHMPPFMGLFGPHKSQKASETATGMI